MENNHIKKLLKEHAISITKNKVMILEHLLEQKHPICANELHKLLQKKCSVNLATIYRTLAGFKEKGLAKELQLDNNQSFFELNISKELHPHFKCEACCRIFCLDKLEFDDTIVLSNLAKNKVIKNIELTYSGICENCL